MDTTSGNHITDELLEIYSLGHATEESVSQLETHLLLCESCQVRLEEVDQFLQVTHAAALELRAKPSRSKLRAPSLAWLWSMPKPVWAGAMAAIVLSVGISAYRPAEPLTAQHEVVLQASRGIEKRPLTHAQPGNVLLSFDPTEIASLPEYKVQIVTTKGDLVWNGTIAGAKGMLHVPVSHPLAAGKYWVRLYGPAETDLLREYQLDLK